MLNERLMDDVYLVAEKMDRGEALTLEEQALFDNIQEDGEAYSVFCLFTAMMDMPAVYTAEEKRHERFLYRDMEDISRHLVRTQEKNFSK